MIIKPEITKFFKGLLDASPTQVILPVVHKWDTFGHEVIPEPKKPDIDLITEEEFRQYKIERNNYVTNRLLIEKVRDYDYKFLDAMSIGFDAPFDNEGNVIPKEQREVAVHVYHSAFNSFRNPIPAVSLIQAGGSAKGMVNAARVSYYGANSEKYSYGALTAMDGKLLKGLINDNHGTPLEHTFLTFRFLIPNPILKQTLKHRAGFSVSEISTRYAMIKERLYVPTRLMKQKTTNKQGSELELIDNHDEVHEKFTAATYASYEAYKYFTEMGIAREITRNQLPNGFFTESIISVNMRSLVHYLNLRLEHHAQFEIRQYAMMMAMAASFVFPDFFAIASTDETMLIKDKQARENLKTMIDALDGGTRASKILADSKDWVDDKQNANLNHLLDKNTIGRNTMLIRLR